MTKYILTHVNDFNYTLTINNDKNFLIYEAILLFINGYKNTQKVFFTASDINPLSICLKNNNGKLSEKMIIKMIGDLAKQINYFNGMGYNIYGLDLDDIIIIDNNYILTNVSYMLPIKNNDMHIYLPIKRPYFSNPEVFKIKELPSKISIKSVYYSIGLLVIYCLINEYLLVGNEILTNKEIKGKLCKLYGTKLYWFLLRCLEDNPDNRQMLLI